MHTYEPFLSDARRFILRNKTIIEAAPLQTYYAALVFCPQGSLLRQKYAQLLPPSIQRLPRTPPDWTPNLQTLTCGKADVVVAISGDSEFLASASLDGVIQLWRPTFGQSCGTLEGFKSTTNALVFSPDSLLLASGGCDGHVRLWNHRIRTLRGALPGVAIVYNLVFSSDGRLLGVLENACTVKLWDVKSRVLLQTLEGHTGLLRSFAFTPNARFLVTSIDGQPHNLWDVTTGKLVRSAQHVSKTITSAALSLDGLLLASAAMDCSIEVWNSIGGTLLSTLSGHTRFVKGLEFSNDSQLLVSWGSPDLRVWHLEKQALLYSIESRLDAPYMARISPNNQLLTTQTFDSVIKLWDLNKGEMACALVGHSNSIRCKVFSGDGQLLVSAAANGTVRLWEN
jgi:WD40 repeat protein